MIGETVGSYRIVSQLGAGGMGIVFVAEHPLLGKRAVVKMLHAEMSQQRDIVERFFNEARASTLVKHPGIVDIFDFGYHPSGRAFIVMELLDGESLAARLKRFGPVPLDRVALFLRQLASALDAAHQRGIVHRDLKPDNLFLCPDPSIPGGERVKILDFGIAKLEGDPGSFKTRTGATMGTPVYMSPEQCQSAGRVDARADVYAVGCILYEMIGGRPPFLGEGITQIIAGHLFEPPPPLRGLAPNVPASVEAVVLRALAKAPADRPQTMALLAAELDAALGLTPQVFPPLATGPHAAGPSAYPTGPGAGHGTTLGRSATEVPGGATTTSGGRRWLGVVLGGVVVAAGAAIAIVATRSSPAAAPPSTGAAGIAAPPAAPPPPAAPTPAPPAPAPATQVKLSIVSEPAGADVFRASDGVRLGVTPFTLELAPSPGEAIFTVKRRGFHDETVTMAADRDAERRLALRPSRSTSRPPPAAAGSVPRPGGSTDGMLDPFANKR